MHPYFTVIRVYKKMMTAGNLASGQNKIKERKPEIAVPSVRKKNKTTELWK